MQYWLSSVDFNVCPVFSPMVIFYFLFICVWLCLYMQSWLSSVDFNVCLFWSLMLTFCFICVWLCFYLYSWLSSRDFNVCPFWSYMLTFYCICVLLCFYMYSSLSSVDFNVRTTSSCDLQKKSRTSHMTLDTPLRVNTEGYDKEAQLGSRSLDY